MRRAATDHRQVLRWYPATWRERYGEELVDLLVDTYGDAALPARARWAIVRAGVNERCRDTGVIGATSPREVRIRAGALVVLVAWSFFMVAGSGFAKYSEHWSAVTPRADQLMPTVAFDTVQGAAYFATTMCLTAALISWPSFVRFARREGWGRVISRCGPAAVALTASVLGTAVIVTMAHHVGSARRSGAGPYEVIAFAWAGLLVVCLATIVVVVGRVVLRLDYSARQLRFLSLTVLLATVAMIVIFIATLVWWIGIAQHASWFFASGIVGHPGTSVPAVMVVCVSIMLAGVAIATWGTRRVALAVLGHRFAS